MTEKRPISNELQNELLDLFKKCLDNHTDGLTLTLEYPHAILEIEIVFKGKRLEN